MGRRTAYLAVGATVMLAAAAPPARAGVLVRFAPGASASERAAARQDAGVNRVRGFGLDGLEVVTGGAAAAAELRRDPEVAYAEPDRTRTAALLPRDPLFPGQWALSRIAAPQAWETTTGSPEVLIAVVDGGADLDHPDLAPNLVAGWDFVDGDARPDDEDPSGHGTLVTGVAAARGDDGFGVAGVAWTTRVMPLRVLDARGEGTVSAAIGAYERAAQAGARVVNLSFAGRDYSRAEHDALAAASRVLFVAAAGNDGADADAVPTYPCAYDLPNVLCVTASNDADGRPAFANVGARNVDLAAPGTAITGPVPGGGWGTASGTSVAAPHVTGVAALLLAREPRARATDLAAALLAGATPALAFAGLTVSGARLDAARALQVVNATPAPAPAPTPAPSPVATPSAGPPLAATPVPASPASPPAAKPAPTPAARPAKLKLRRAGVRRGRLEVVALITRKASGRVDVAYRAGGRTTRFTAPIAAGRIRVTRRLPRAQAGASGILTLRWRGSAAVREATVRLRAAAQPARLRRDAATLAGGRLRVAGRISPRARGSVRLRLVAADGGEVSVTAPIDGGRWHADVPSEASSGYLTLQFTGYRRAPGGPMRGEQDGIALAGGRPRA